MNNKSVEEVTLFKTNELQDVELKELLKNQYGAEAHLDTCGGYLTGELYFATPKCMTCGQCGGRDYGKTGIDLEVHLSAKTFENGYKLMKISMNQNIAFLHWGCGSCISMSLKDFIKLGERLKKFWKNQRTPNYEE